MSRLVTAHNAIAEALRTHLGQAARSVEPYEGPLNIDELKRLGIPYPAVIVAYLGLSPVGDGEEVLTRWGAYCITSNTPNVKRHAAVMALSEAVYRIVRDRLGDLDVEAGDPRDLTIDNRYSSQIARLGVSVHLVPFKIDMTLPALTAEEIDAIADLTLVHGEIVHTESSGTFGTDPDAADDIVP